MRYRNSRAVAVGGVIASAAATVALVMPAARQFGTDAGMWRGAALFALPILVLLTVTGLPHYGLPRAAAVAGAITVIVSSVAWVLAVFAVVSALSGTAAGVVLTVAVFAVPPLVLVALGLLALRLRNGAADPDDDGEPVPPLTPATSRIPHR
jgi:hypothetical protein